MQKFQYCADRSNNDVEYRNGRSGVLSADVAIIGAGISGLTAAAVAAHRGASVLVIEAHALPGGCASFYQRGRYRFDVGATLAGGFGPRGVHSRLLERLGVPLAATRLEPAMAVHLPDARVARYGDERWPAERRRVFGDEAEPFWRAQERLADAAWTFSAGLASLPADVANFIPFARALRPSTARLAFAAGLTLGSLLPSGASTRLRTFIDAQLLITAQAGAGDTDAAYGATALDFAREGAYSLALGTSQIAEALVTSARRDGARFLFGRRAARVAAERSRVLIELVDGGAILAKTAISAIPLVDLLRCAPSLRDGGFARKIVALPQRWGAFTLYCGLPAGAVDADIELHHQLVERYDLPLGEGNLTFVSLSAAGENRRARGGRAVTVSTHTDVARWERAEQAGTLPELRREYERRLTRALDLAVPGASSRAEVLESATPQTFAHYTGRTRGLVGGVPQTVDVAGLRARSDRTPLERLFVCGDSTFPGQSTVGASLSGLAAARSALAALRRYPSFSCRSRKKAVFSIT